MNLVSSFLHLQWQKDSTSFFLAWLKWTELQANDTLPKFSSPAIFAPVSCFQQGWNATVTAQMHPQLRHRGTS